MHLTNKRNEIKMADTNGQIQKYYNQSKNNVLCVISVILKYYCF